MALVLSSIVSLLTACLSSLQHSDATIRPMNETDLQEAMGRIEAHRGASTFPAIERGLKRLLTEGYDLVPTIEGDEIPCLSRCIIMRPLPTDSTIPLNERRKYGGLIVDQGDMFSGQLTFETYDSEGVTYCNIDSYIEPDHCKEDGIARLVSAALEQSVVANLTEDVQRAVISISGDVDAEWAQKAGYQCSPPVTDNGRSNTQWRKLVSAESPREAGSTAV